MLGWRFNPVALALERVGGQGEAPAALMLVESGPIHLDTRDPELAQCGEHKGYVRLRVPPIAHRSEYQLLLPAVEML